MPNNKKEKRWKEIQRDRQLKQQRAQEAERIRLEVERKYKNGCARAKVGRVTSKFKDMVEVQMKSTKSPEASKYGVQGMCVVVDGVLKLSASFDEKELEDAILERKTDEQ